MDKKTLVVLQEADFNELVIVNKKILAALEQLKLVRPAEPTEYMSRQDFMKKCRIGSTKFHELVKAGKMKYHRVGKKMVYVPLSEVARFFAGEL